MGPDGVKKVLRSTGCWPAFSTAAFLRLRFLSKELGEIRRINFGRRGEGLPGEDEMAERLRRLLLILTGPDRSSATRQLMTAGYTEDEVRGAWNFARAAGYTESTGLGADRLTSAGKARAAESQSR